jgi:hypothetical protein
MARPFLVPFRRLLRLAGSRWRYSTPPPHGLACYLHNNICPPNMLDISRTPVIPARENSGQVCDYRRGVDWILHILTTLTHDSELHVITALPLISTLYKTLRHAKSSQSSLVISRQRIYNSLTVSYSTHKIFFPQPNSFLHDWTANPRYLSYLPTANCLVAISSQLPSTASSQLTLSQSQSQSQSQIYFTTGGLPPVSSSWRKASHFFNWTLGVIVLT